MPRRILATAVLAVSTLTLASVAFGQYTPAPQPTYAPPSGQFPPPQYPPPQYAPPPGYGPQPQPYYAAPPELPYKSNEAIPPGYHPEERARKGLTIAGGATLGAFYFPALLVGASTSQTYLKWLMLPVVGPWIAIGERPRCNSSDFSCVGAFFGNFLIAFDGVGQLTGATLLTIGFAAPKTVLIRDDLRTARPEWRLRPAMVGNGGFGIALGGEIL